MTGKLMGLVVSFALVMSNSALAQQSEREIAKEIAKTCLKGDVLQCFFKALTLSPSAGIDDENALKLEAEHAKQCHQLLEQYFPRYRERYLLHSRVFGTAARQLDLGQPEALNTVRRGVAMAEETHTVDAGIKFCISTIKRTDKSLGEQWENRLARLQKVESIQAYEAAKQGR